MPAQEHSANDAAAIEAEMNRLVNLFRDHPVPASGEVESAMVEIPANEFTTRALQGLVQQLQTIVERSVTLGEDGA